MTYVDNRGDPRRGRSSRCPSPGPTTDNDDPGLDFEGRIPRAERDLLGQFYTPRPVADLLVALTLRGRRPRVLDPGCGCGAVLTSAYRQLRRGGLGHREALGRLWGVELNPAAARLAAGALTRPGDRDEDPPPHRILARSFFDLTPAQPVPSAHHDGPVSPLGSGPGALIPRFHCVVGNPPYLRSQRQDALAPGQRQRLFAAARRVGVEAPPKNDLFAFFIYHALGFLEPEGRLGFVTPASWLTADYAATLQKLLLHRLRLVAVVASSAEPLFPRAEVSAVLLVARHVAGSSSAAARCRDPLRFVTLKRPLGELAGAPDAPGGGIQQLASRILQAPDSAEDPRMRVRLVAPDQARTLNDRAARTWSSYLRAPLPLHAMYDRVDFTPLGQLARVGLGFKSLQNAFFYLDRAAVEDHGVEARFLLPILRHRDLKAAGFCSRPEPSTWLFRCPHSEADLEGTGALRYLQAMAQRPASSRKQSGEPRTIRQALQAQGGVRWYAPKARPVRARLWLRKAFHCVLSPFIFATPVLCDQRFNYIEPKGNLSIDSLAAALTTTLFSHSLEVNGAAMGGGALEAATRKLRRFPVLDLRRLSPAQRRELVGLARRVWAQEAPASWGTRDPDPGPALRALDAEVLGLTGLALTPEDIYADLRAACAARLAAAGRKA